MARRESVLEPIKTSKARRYPRPTQSSEPTARSCSSGPKRKRCSPDVHEHLPDEASLQKCESKAFPAQDGIDLFGRMYEAAHRAAAHSHDQIGEPDSNPCPPRRSGSHRAVDTAAAGRRLNRERANCRVTANYADECVRDR